MGGEGDQGGGWQGGELVVGEKEDVQVEEGGEGALLDLGELVVLQVEALQALLPVEQLPVQLGQSVVAQVESHQLHQGVEDLMGEEMAGDVVAGDVEEQQVVEAGEEVGREEGERVVLGEQLLQVGALLEDGRGQGGQVVVGEVEVRRERGGTGRDRCLYLHSRLHFGLYWLCNCWQMW